MGMCQFCKCQRSLNGYDKPICETEERADTCADYRDVLLENMRERLRQLSNEQLRNLSMEMRRIAFLEKIIIIKAHLAEHGWVRVLASDEERQRGEFDGVCIEAEQIDKIDALIPGNRVELMMYRDIGNGRGKWYGKNVINL